MGENLHSEDPVCAKPLRMDKLAGSKRLGSERPRLLVLFLCWEALRLLPAHLSMLRLPAFSVPQLLQLKRGAVIHPCSVVLGIKENDIKQLRVADTVLTSSSSSVLLIYLLKNLFHVFFFFNSLMFCTVWWWGNVTFLKVRAGNSLNKF